MKDSVNADRQRANSKDAGSTLKQIAFKISLLRENISQF
jgi:hypothetical protein